MTDQITERQALVLSCFTGIGLAPWPRVQTAIEQKLGRPIMTHEFAGGTVWIEAREAFREEAMAMLPWDVS